MPLTPLPEDLQEVVQHEPRFVEVDRARRSTTSGEQAWWRGLVDTVNCYDPEEVAAALRDKGLSQARAEEGAVWLRPATEEETR
ncbi:MAG: hypothetical protein KY468_05540 [Armatimonadetes bacterium]|nr:hypothetical protein [Armatimonadota bacterium]